MFGSVTRKKVCQPLAPSTIAASSSSVPCSCISGISSRATKGKVTKVVASTMPGTAKMILMSCSSSQGPNQPCAPNSSTKIMPEITGETANGRSIRVIRTFLPRKLELGDAPGRGDAEDEVQRHRDARDQQGELGRAQGVRLADRLPSRPAGPWPEPARRPVTSGSSSTSARNRSAMPISAQRTTRRLAGGAGDRARARSWRRGMMAAVAMAQTAARRRAAHWSRLIMSSRAKDTHQHHHGDRRRAGVVVLLQLGDDEQRDDLRLHRHVARDEDDRAVLAERPRERQREAGEQRRRDGRERSTRAKVCQRRAPRLAAASSTSTSSPPAPAAPCGPRTAGR